MENVFSRVNRIAKQLQTKWTIGIGRVLEFSFAVQNETCADLFSTESGEITAQFPYAKVIGATRLAPLIITSS
jgi:hypothetical protein